MVNKMAAVKRKQTKLLPLLLLSSPCMCNVLCMYAVCPQNDRSIRSVDSPFATDHFEKASSQLSMGASEMDELEKMCNVAFARSFIFECINLYMLRV